LKGNNDNNRSREKQVALFADEIIGQQQAVIKGFRTILGRYQNYRCMILGDGGIGLIIDIESLIELSEKAVLLDNVR
jgi:chemotaxis protein histidine kinase CheA